MALHLVHPDTTRVSTLDSIALPGQDLWTMFIKNVHVYPSHLDVELFKEALGKTLSVYPHVAGRLLRDSKGAWKIGLTNSPVPLTVQLLPPSPERPEGFPFPSNFVVQSDDLTSEFIDSDPTKPFLKGDENEPLLRLKMSFWHGDSRDEYRSGGTILGVAWNHTLGDASTLHRFMIYLSEVYQYIQPCSTVTKLPPSPVLARHFFEPVSTQHPALAATIIPLMPHLSRDYELPELWGMYTELNERAAPIRLRLPGEVLDKLFKSVRLGNVGSKERCTIQDAMTAYLITVLNGCLAVPIRALTNTINYRAPDRAKLAIPCFNDPLLAGNCFFMTTTLIPEKSNRPLCEIALAIRKSITKARAGTWIEDWMSFAADLMLKSANAGRYQWFFGREGDMCVNSNYRYNWNDAHFGFPGLAKFYTSGSWDRLIRVFLANPGPASAHSETATASADITLQVPRDIRDRVIQTIKEGFPEVEVDSTWNR